METFLSMRPGRLTAVSLLPSRFVAPTTSKPCSEQLLSCTRNSLTSLS